MQVDGTLKAGALLPPLSASEESGDDDLGAEEGNEEEEQYLGQVRRVKQKETTQPSLKAAAQHRKQRLRELQEEYELAATLGSYTGEKGVSCIQWNCLHILQPPRLIRYLSILSQGLDTKHLSVLPLAAFQSDYMRKAFYNELQSRQIIIAHGGGASSLSRSQGTHGLCRLRMTPAFKADLEVMRSSSEDSYRRTP